MLFKYPLIFFRHVTMGYNELIIESSSNPPDQYCIKTSSTFYSSFHADSNFIYHYSPFFKTTAKISIYHNIYVTHQSGWGLQDAAIYYFYHPTKPIFLCEDKNANSWFIYLDKHGQTVENCKKYQRLLKSQKYNDYKKCLMVRYHFSP